MKRSGVARVQSFVSWTFPYPFGKPGSAAASGWAGWALAHPEFWVTFNPIQTGGGQIMLNALGTIHILRNYL